jgi:hypothetical protein
MMRASDRGNQMPRAYQMPFFERASDTRGHLIGDGIRCPFSSHALPTKGHLIPRWGQRAPDADAISITAGSSTVGGVQ